MNWRNQTRDLGIVHSLVEDLKLFWQLKNTRWEKRQKEVQQASEIQQPQGASQDLVEQKFRTLLKNDSDYREVRYRIIQQRKEIKQLYTFLDLDYPQELKKLKFTSLLLDNDSIEGAISALEKLIILCRVSSYPYYYCITAIRQPKQFFTSLWSFYKSQR